MRSLLEVRSKANLLVFSLEGWLALGSVEDRKCNHTSVKDDLTESESKKLDWAVKSFAFDGLASEKLGPIRKVGKQAHKL